MLLATPGDVIESANPAAAGGSQCGLKPRLRKINRSVGFSPLEHESFSRQVADDKVPLATTQHLPAVESSCLHKHPRLRTAAGQFVSRRLQGACSGTQRTMAFDESALACFALLHTPYIKLTNWPTVRIRLRTSADRVGPHFTANSATCFPIFNDAVAAGDGALQTLMTRSCRRMTKSSTSFPSSPNA